MIKTGTRAVGQTIKQQSNWARPLMPNDHGAYAMLLLPMLLGFILGSIHAQNLSANMLLGFVLFAIALVCLFFATEPVSVLFKPRVSPAARRRAGLWLGTYVLAAVLCGVLLLFVGDRWALGWFLVPAIVLMLSLLLAVRQRKQRSLSLRLPGIAGLTLSAPAAYYVAAGSLDAPAWGLWVACAVYFVGTVFNVRAWFEINRLKKGGVSNPRLPAWLVTSILLYIAAGTLLIWACVVVGALPWGAFLAFVPSLARAAWTLWHTPAHLPIKTVGLIEFAQSFLFAILLIAAVSGAISVG